MSSNEIRFVVKDVGNIAAFKNKKRAILDRNTGKMRTLTAPKMQQQMDAITRAIESQLFSAIPIREGATWTAAQVRSWIACSLPLDDSRQWIGELTVKSRNVDKDFEGCEIVIERL